jgi:hypothetical protein
VAAIGEIGIILMVGGLVAVHAWSLNRRYGSVIDAEARHAIELRSQSMESRVSVATIPSLPGREIARRMLVRFFLPYILLVGPGVFLIVHSHGKGVEGDIGGGLVLLSGLYRGVAGWMRGRRAQRLARDALATSRELAE